jgi:hypothetical protein
MLRALVALLLLANLAFYAWTQGWADSVVGIPARGDREPERLARQVRPESLKILPASAALAPPPVACLEAGPFADAALPAVEAAAQAALPGGSWATANTEVAATWIVYMGKFPNREIQARKEEELKRRNVAFEAVQGHPALEPGLSIGRFDSRAAADQALEAFNQQGVRTAKVVELTPAVTQHWLRVDKAEPALVAQLRALRGPPWGPGFAPCTRPGST